MWLKHGVSGSVVGYVAQGQADQGHIMNFHARAKGFKDGDKGIR